jgi:lipopolysaccharide export system protein LptC
VQLFHDKGYQFTTDEAQVDINQDDAWGEKPVLIQGGFGEIRGKGFRVLDHGSVVVVGGPAKAILNLRSSGPSDKPADTTKP